MNIEKENEEFWQNQRTTTNCIIILLAIVLVCGTVYVFISSNERYEENDKNKIGIISWVQVFGFAPNIILGCTAVHLRNRLLIEVKFGFDIHQILVYLGLFSMFVRIQDSLTNHLLSTIYHPPIVKTFCFEGKNI